MTRSHVPGSSAPAGSCTSTWSAPSSASRRALSTTRGRFGMKPEKARPAYRRPPASRTAAAADSRFSTSLRGSCSRKISMPLSPAQRHLQRRRAAARLDAADPLPWALGPLLDGGVEAAAAAHLERGEAGLVEDLGHLQHTRGGDGADQRLLGEQADRGVDDAGHAREMYRASRVSTRITSPTLTNRGTATTAPVSSVAGLVTLETVSPLTPGSVSTTFSSTAAGSWSEVGLPSTVSSCTVSFSRMYCSSSRMVSAGNASWSKVSEFIRCTSLPSL